MVRIVINDQEYEVANGSMIIEAADAVNIPIPRFCYHKKLSIAANCRMCLVEVEKVAKPLPACATPITEGMKIWTNSKPAQDAQKSIMEFLLINHPLDCPICDQGGECELQDVSMQYGNDVSRFNEGKRSVKHQDIGPLIATEMTRCIHCTRCVRFGKEIAGMRELGATGRGEFTQIGTFIEQSVDSEISGNIIDLCPVGALTDKPFRFRARAFELESKPYYSPHDSIGANIILHVRRNEVMRVVPRENNDLNEIWIADRDRYGYEGLLHEDRLRHPLIKKDHKWTSSSWIDSLDKASESLKHIIQHYGPDEISALIAPSATLEEAYLLQKLMRALGSNNIDHRLRLTDLQAQEQAPSYPNLGIKFAQIEQQATIILIGSNLHKELPLAGIKFVKAAKNGCNIITINPAKFKFNFKCTTEIITKNEYALELAAILKALKVEHPLIKGVTVNNTHKEIAKILSTSSSGLIVMGHLAQMDPHASEIISLANMLSKATKLNFGCLNLGANDAGHWLAGAVPHRLPGGVAAKQSGKDVHQMLQKPSKAYILFGLEPEIDTFFGSSALETIKQADFVLTISPYLSENLLSISDIILPSVPFSETDGTYVNLEGTWQKNLAAVQPFGEARPGWKILRVLGNKLNICGFEYQTIDEITEEVKENIAQQPLNTSWQEIPLSSIYKASAPSLTSYVPLYMVDNVVRRAKALQKTKDAETMPKLKMNLETAKHYKIDGFEKVIIKTHNGLAKVLLEIDNNIAADLGLLPLTPQTIAVSLPMQSLEIMPCNG